MRHLTLSIFLLISIPVAAQTPYVYHEKDTLYYTENGENALTAGDAAYYRVVRKEDDRELHTYYWLPNHVKRHEGYYKDNNRTGLFKTYYKSGSFNSEIIYGMPRTRFVQFWSPEGKPLLERGNGIVRESALLFWNASYLIIEDSLLTCAGIVRPEKGDTLCSGYGIDPEYPGGNEALYRQMNRTLVYPTRAKLAEVMGKVMLEFVVSKTGALEEMGVTYGIGYGCDEAALAALSTLQPFKPAMYKGKPVKVKMGLPLIFHLEADDEEETKKGRKKKRKG